MNILFLNIRMFHPQRGGIERVSDLLCREFIKNGHRVFFLHSVRDETLFDYSYPAPLNFFPNPSVQEVEENGSFYRHFLESNHIDFVINQDSIAYHKLCAYSKGLSGVHTITVIHSNPLIIYNYLWSLTMRLRDNSLIEKFKRIARIIKVPKIKADYLKKLKSCYEDSFNHSDLLCLLSWKFIPELESLNVPNFDKNKIIAIGNPNTYSPREFCTKKKQILYVGRIEWYQKRIDRLVGIWKRLYMDFPDWELIIVGGGPMEQTLKQKFSNIERVTFTGYQDPEPYYREGSILCLTSDFEGWGMVLTEAMTFGVIPVAFNSFAAVTDILEDGKTGILVPPFSKSKYVDALRGLMTDKELRERMSQSCMRSIGRFDMKHIASQWEEQFAKLKKRPVS